MDKQKGKGKGKGVEAPISPERRVRGNVVMEDAVVNSIQRSDGADSSQSVPDVPKFTSRNASSTYDYVKEKVWLGDNCDHYYVFSRFLLSRMLTVTKIPNHVAIKIALELKKLLIDNSLLDV